MYLIYTFILNLIFNHVQIIYPVLKSNPIQPPQPQKPVQQILLRNVGRKQSPYRPWQDHGREAP